MSTPAPGTLLIADPFLKDLNFKRSVIFICEHQAEGSFGFILNRPYEFPLNELVAGIEDLPIPVFCGGPVQMDTIHFLHQYPSKIPGSYKVSEDAWFGGNFETAISLIRSGEIDMSRIRFYIGYSGWSSGQLDEELKEKSWITVNATRRLLFHKDINQLWKEALRHLGGDYEMLVNFPVDPNPRLN